MGADSNGQMLWEWSDMKWVWSLMVWVGAVRSSPCRALGLTSTITVKSSPPCQSSSYTSFRDWDRRLEVSRIPVGAAGQHLAQSQQSDTSNDDMQNHIQPADSQVQLCHLESRFQQGDRSDSV